MRLVLFQPIRLQDYSAKSTVQIKEWYNRCLHAAIEVTSTVKTVQISLISMERPQASGKMDLFIGKLQPHISQPTRQMTYFLMYFASHPNKNTF